LAAFNGRGSEDPRSTRLMQGVVLAVGVFS
jgi:hypothetical protein